MMDKNLLPSLKMRMRSSVKVSSEVLSALLETPALHALLDSFSEAIILSDGESRVRFLNLAAERVNRLSRQETLGLAAPVCVRPALARVDGDSGAPLGEEAGSNLKAQVQRFERQLILQGVQSQGSKR